MYYIAGIQDTIVAGWTESEPILNLFIRYFLERMVNRYSYGMEQKTICMHRVQSKDDLFDVLDSYVENNMIHRPRINKDVMIRNQKIVIVYDYYNNPFGISTVIDVRSVYHPKELTERRYNEAKKKFGKIILKLIICTNFFHSNYSQYIDALSNLYGVRNLELDYIKYATSINRTYHIGSLLKEV